MSKKQQNNFNKVKKDQKKVKSTFKYFFRVMLIAFIPIFAIDIILTFILKGQMEWLIWLVTAVGFIIAGIIGLIVDSKITKQQQEEAKNKKKGKAIPKKENIDIFS